MKKHFPLKQTIHILEKISVFSPQHQNAKYPSLKHTQKNHKIPDSAWTPEFSIDQIKKQQIACLFVSL